MPDASSELFFRLDGKVAVVTGGGQGIGQAIAFRLAAAGAKIAVFDRDAASANATAQKIQGIGIGGDVTSDTDVARAADLAKRELGPIDILVNNAGITGRAAPLIELSRSDYEQVMAVNLIGPFMWCKAVAPGMLERRYGRIVNIASVAGKEGNPNLGPYSASKAAIMAMTKSLAKELVGKGDITVNCVTPAVIHTPLLDGLPEATVQYMVSKVPMGRMGRSEEIAAVVHFLASAECSFTTGQAYDVSGGRSTY